MNKNIIIGLSIFFLVISSLNVLGAGYIITDSFDKASGGYDTGIWTIKSAGVYQNNVTRYDGTSSMCLNYGGAGAPGLKTVVNITANVTCALYFSTTVEPTTGTSAGVWTGSDFSYGIFNQWVDTKYKYGVYNTKHNSTVPINTSWVRLGVYMNTLSNSDYYIDNNYVGSNLSSTGAGYLYQLSGGGGAISDGTTCYDQVRCWAGNYTSEPASIIPSSIGIEYITPVNNTASITTTPSFNFNISAISGTFNMSVIVNGTNKGDFNGLTLNGNYSITSSAITNFNTLLSWYIRGVDASDSTKVFNSSTNYIAILNSSTSTTTTTNIKLCNFVSGSIALKDITGCQ